MTSSAATAQTGNPTRDARPQDGSVKSLLRNQTRVRANKAMLVVYLLVLATLLAFAIVVGDADYHATLLAWLPFLAALVSLAFSRAYVSMLKHYLHVEDKSHVSDCVRGTESSFGLELTNTSILFYFCVRVKLQVATADGTVIGEETSTLALSPFGHEEVLFHSVFDHIGVFEVGVKQVALHDFLGLFSMELDHALFSEIQVVPQIQHLKQWAYSVDVTQESTRASRAVLADSLDYAFVREYEPGDPLKTIHWKLSAITDVYQTKLFEVSTSSGIALVMDLYSEDEDPQHRMAIYDAVVECALSIARCGVRMGLDVDLFFCDKDGNHVRSTNWLDRDLSAFVRQLPGITNDIEHATSASSLVRDQVISRYGQNNIIACSGNFGFDLVSSLVDAKSQRRSPSMVAVVPPGLDQRVQDKRCATLKHLDGAGIAYRIVSSADQLAQV